MDLSVVVNNEYLEYVRILNGISLAASLLVVLSFASFIELRRATGHYSLWVALANILNSFFVILDGKSGSTQCEVSAFGRTYANFATLAVSVTLANRLVQLFDVENQNRRITIGKREVFFVWVCPLIVSLVPFTINAYGKPPGGRWCWLNQHASIDFFLFYYAPLWLTLAYTLVVYSYIYSIGHAKV